MSTDQSPEFLVSADVETTGLSPSEGHVLLEIAVFIANSTAPFDLLDEEGFHAVIRHDRDEVYALANDYVREMHTKTGLWDKVSDGTPLEEVDEQLLAYLQSHIGKREGRVFGNSVRLDMNFIDAYLPKTAAWLHYRFLDATGLAWFAHKNFGTPYFEKRKVHSAVEDIQESLSELRHVAGALTARPSREQIATAVSDALSEFANEDPKSSETLDDFIVFHISRLLA